MRTARTIGTKADGSEVILAPSSTPIPEQLEAFQAYAVKGLPKDYVRVEYRTSDGPVRFLTAASLVSVREAEARAQDKLMNRADWLARQAEEKAKADKAEAAERQRKLDAVNAGKESQKKPLFSLKPKKQSINENL